MRVPDSLVVAAAWVRTLPPVRWLSSHPGPLALQAWYDGEAPQSVAWHVAGCDACFERARELAWTSSMARAGLLASSLGMVSKEAREPRALSAELLGDLDLEMVGLRLEDLELGDLEPEEISGIELGEPTADKARGSVARRSSASQGMFSSVGMRGVPGLRGIGAAVAALLVAVGASTGSVEIAAALTGSHHPSTAAHATAGASAQFSQSGESGVTHPGGRWAASSEGSPNGVSQLGGGTKVGSNGALGAQPGSLRANSAGSTSGAQATKSLGGVLPGATPRETGASLSPDGILSAPEPTTDPLTLGALPADASKSPARGCDPASTPAASSPPSATAPSEAGGASCSGSVSAGGSAPSHAGTTAAVGDVPLWLLPG